MVFDLVTLSNNLPLHVFIILRFINLVTQAETNLDSQTEMFYLWVS